MLAFSIRRATIFMQLEIVASKQAAAEVEWRLLIWDAYEYFK